MKWPFLLRSTHEELVTKAVRDEQYRAVKRSEEIAAEARKRQAEELEKVRRRVDEYVARLTTVHVDRDYPGMKYRVCYDIDERAIMTSQDAEMVAEHAAHAIAGQIMRTVFAHRRY